MTHLKMLVTTDTDRREATHFLAAACLIVLAACSGGSKPAGVGADEGEQAPAAVPEAYTGPFALANSYTALYSIDPSLYRASWIADFVWPDEPMVMLDMAVDADQRLLGSAALSDTVSTGALFSIDPNNGDCTFLADLPRAFNALAVGPDDGVLWGATNSGALYQIDPDTGQSESIGRYNGYSSSGDLIVLPNDGGMFASVHHGRGNPSWLARVDTSLGDALGLGSTQVLGLSGLVYFEDRLIGFSRSGGVYRLGLGDTIEVEPVEFIAGATIHGAAISLSAPWNGWASLAGGVQP